MRLLLLIAAAISIQSFAQTASPSPTNPSITNNTSGTSGQASAGNATPANISKLSLRSLLYPGATTAIFVRWMPWFGDQHHLDIGYRSNDPAQIDRQIEDMQSRGIDGAIVDWYGPSQDLKNRATQQFLSSAERHGNFKFAISVDNGALKDCKSSCDPTRLLIDNLSYLMKQFASSPAYARFENRPLITFFGMDKTDIDWRKVRQNIGESPLFVFRNSGAFRLPQGDGGFSWIAPETVSPDDPSGFRYLDRFYETAAHSSGKFAMGSVYKGFDDRLAGWGKGRRIDQQCGQTWLDSFAVLNRHYSNKHQLPAVIIVTWNDYEEGTEIETGIENCIRLSVTLDGSKLNWKIDGPGRTIDHFAIFESQGDNELRQIQQLEPEQSRFELDTLQLPPGRHRISVQAVGKPSIQNHLAGPVYYDNRRR
jgi:hypothetical protein